MALLKQAESPLPTKEKKISKLVITDKYLTRVFYLYLVSTF